MFLCRLCSVKHVPNLQIIVKDLPIVARRNQFWEIGKPGGNTKGFTNAERGLHPPLPDQIKLDKVTKHHQLLCIPSQEPLPVGGIASTDEQKCSRVGQKSRISGLLQPTIFGPKTKQQVETYTRSQQPQHIPQGRKILNGDTRNNKDLSPDRGVGIDFKDAHRLQGSLLPHTNFKSVLEVLKVSCPGLNLPV